MLCGLVHHFVETPALAPPATADDMVVYVLQQARSLVARPLGWCQRRWSQHYLLFSRYCVLGALDQASDGNKGAFEAAMGLFADAIQMPRGMIASWNDADYRKKREVLRAFDQAIALAREQS